MSSLKTKQYKFHKWSDEDNVSRVEFNENFENIDSKLKYIDSKNSNLYNKIEVLKNIINEYKINIKSDLEEFKKLEELEHEKIIKNQESNKLNLERQINLNKSSITQKMQTNIESLRQSFEQNLKTASDSLTNINKNLKIDIDKNKANIDKIFINYKNLKKQVSSTFRSGILHSCMINSEKNKIIRSTCSDWKKTSENINLDRIILKSDNDLITITINSIDNNTYLVTGPYTIGNQNYYGSWTVQYGANGKSYGKIAGKDGERILGSINYNGKLVYIFQNGIKAMDKLNLNQINLENGVLVVYFEAMGAIKGNYIRLHMAVTYK